MLPRTEKRGPKNGPKKGPSKNRFSEAFGSGWGEGRRSVRTPSALEIDDIVGGSARRAPRRGRRIEDAMRRAHRRPRDPGLAICFCFGIRQVLGRSWQVLGIGSLGGALGVPKWRLGRRTGSRKDALGCQKTRAKTGHQKVKRGRNFRTTFCQKGGFI